MNIEELENKVKELQAEIAKLKEEKKPVKRWRAKEDEEYFFISVNGDIDQNAEEDDYCDDYLYKTGNYFQTEQEAENYKEKLLIYHEVKDLAIELNNGEKIDWEDNTQNKYAIVYEDDGDEKAFINYFYTTLKHLGQIYCLDENFLKIAKERIGEERLKKLFKEE